LFTDEYFSFGNKKEPNSVSFPLKLGGVNWRVFWYPISQRRLSNNVFARIDYVQKKRTQHFHSAAKAQLFEIYLVTNNANGQSKF
jgi:hypothetical protein